MFIATFMFTLAVTVVEFDREMMRREAELAQALNVGKYTGFDGELTGSGLEAVPQ